MKRIWKFISFFIIILIIVGVIFGISFTLKENEKKANLQVFSKVQTKEAEVTEFFTYGTSLNITCKLTNISKDNYESARLLLTDGKEFEKEYKIYSSFEDGGLVLTTTNYINDAINLEDLQNGKYYFMIRLKLNNSSNPKFYLLKNISNYNNIDYYSIKNSKRFTIENNNYENDNKTYTYMMLNCEQSSKPENVYDIVIDAGEGGDSPGAVFEGNKEADITLEYANSLKKQLEAQGLKVKLTRDNSNTDSYKEKNTYGENGRITTACKSKAKYMISLHVNNGNSDFAGVEVYAPCKSNLEFANNLAKNIVEKTSMEYSNVGKYRVLDGVYVKNFSDTEIATYENNAKRNGYENYNINTDTPLLYTIREVGGIATNAFVDGRNKNYDANKYYNSNQGLECYQLELGYIKNDIETILNEKDSYVQAIAETVNSLIK